MGESSSEALVNQVINSMPVINEELAGLQKSCPMLEFLDMTPKGINFMGERKLLTNKNVNDLITKNNDIKVVND